MATYTHNGLGGSPAATWYSVGIDDDTPVSTSTTLVVLTNSDGTQTRLSGVGFTFSGNNPTGGTITSISRTNVSGATTYETVTGLNLSLVSLLNAPDDGNRSAFALIFQGVDTFNGHAGNDFFVGGPSGDSFLGGTGGVDTVSYDNATAAVTANLANTGTPVGDAVGDVFTSIENLIGSDFADVLTGSGAGNVISGGEGNDTLNGGNGTTTGNDTLNGGGGSDTANYTNTNIAVGITVTLSTTSTVVGGVGDTVVGTDTLTSVERIRGTSFADSFTVTTNFSGNSGNGAEFEGNGGNDIYVGIGNTRIGFSQALAGVTVNLLAGTAQSTLGGDAAGVGVDSFAGTVGPDSINRINAVRGSNFADFITAAGGRGGFDFIGGGGNDILIGTTEGINNFDNNEARYDFGVTTPNAISVVLDTVSTVSDIGGTAFGTDTLTNIERVRGTALNDTFVATANFSAQYGAQNFFEGLGGNDSITGNGATNASYNNALDGVTINLATGSAQSTLGGDAAGVGIDTFVSGVTGVTGSAFADIMIGSNSAEAETFNGNGGNDVIDGGGGILDRANYRSAAAGINANLQTGFIVDGNGGTDTVTNIEGVNGSEFNDIILGKNGITNQLQGNHGDDQITGGNGNDLLVGDDAGPAGGLYAGDFGSTGTLFDIGNDTLNGGVGADQMWGGKGNDTYVVDDAGDVVTELSVQGTDLVQTTLASFNLGANVENLTFTDNGTHLAVGNELANVMTGGTGNDTFFGQDGVDTLVGGGGADTLVAHTEAGIFLQDADNLSGGAGNDTLYGESVDILNGGADFDILQVINDFAMNLDLAAAGIEYVNSGFGHDIYTAASGSTAIEVYAGGGNDSVTGGSGNDNLWAGVGVDTLVGNGGNDLLVGDLGADSLSGGAGNDRIYVDSDDTFINGGADFDAAYIATGTGITLNMATANLEWVSDFAGGNDTINASATTTGVEMYMAGGTDNMTGGSGNDLMFAGSGNDTMVGGDGSDALIGQEGADSLSGGIGNDRLYIDADDILIDGGVGTDVAYIIGGTGMSINMTTTSLEYVEDQIGGNDTINASGVSVAISIFGGGGTDIVTGGAFADTLWGGAGGDTLTGNNGADLLMGEAGIDRLIGGVGNDILNGGADADTFVWTTGGNTDTVNGWQDGVDRLEFNGVAGLDDISDLNITTNGANAEVFFGASLLFIVTGAAGQIGAGDLLFT